MENKYYCDVCDYGTDRQNSYKKHLDTQKHFKNARESSVTIDIVKFKPQLEKINIEIYPEKIKEEPDNALKFLQEVNEELTQLRQENLLLKMNMQYQQFNNEYNHNNFTSVFDDDFTSLFE